MKYTLRKFGLLVIVAAIVAAPFAWQAYQKAYPSDPYIIMARAVAAFASGDIDVINVFDGMAIPDRLVVIVNIAKYTSWTDRQKENFERHVLIVARNHGSGSLEVLIGWGYPSRSMRIQGLVECETLRQLDCTWSSLDEGIGLRQVFIKWPGIGNP